jgi:hypothetical protein
LHSDCLDALILFRERFVGCDCTSSNDPQPGARMCGRGPGIPCGDGLTRLSLPATASCGTRPQPD